MDKETQSRIFDPFFTTKFTGRGLGLAALLGIVRGHKGSVKIYSEPEKGTTFKILLPASEKQPEKIDGAISDDVGEKRWIPSGKILLVDDEDTVRALGKRMLERIGFEVLLAGNGREAVDIFKENSDKIACVLLDLTMPYMDGEECFRELNRIKKNVQVIISSGYSECDVTPRFAGKGMAAFIQKPYLYDTLKTKILSVLQK